MSTDDLSLSTIIYYCRQSEMFTEHVKHCDLVMLHDRQLRLVTRHSCFTPTRECSNSDGAEDSSLLGSQTNQDAHYFSLLG